MTIQTKTIWILALILLASHGQVVLGSTTQNRMDRDIEAGTPIVIQVSVALADNKHQWIVPVPSLIGNGQDTRTNLYWGARYGLKTFLLKEGGWAKVAAFKPQDRRILERLVLKRSFRRNARRVPVYLVADAWDGRYIKETIGKFLNYNAGRDVLDLQLKGKKIQAGGKAHLMVYVGHNALMDYAGAQNPAPLNPNAVPNKLNNDAIVLACKSKPYFLSRLERLGAFPLVLTTGLMAPEAYSLQAAIEQWIAGEDTTQIRKAAARSYHHYQKTGQRAAERLFGVK